MARAGRGYAQRIRMGVVEKKATAMVTYRRARRAGCFPPGVIDVTQAMAYHLFSFFIPG
jgi:hypothetical protein